MNVHDAVAERQRYDIGDSWRCTNDFVLRHQGLGQRFRAGLRAGSAGGP